MKLYRPSEANLLFDGASLVLYMIGVIVYLANIVKGLRVVSAGRYDVELVEGEVAVGTTTGEGVLGRDDSLKVLSASNTILALVLVGVLVLQAGQWYAERKQGQEVEEMRRVKEEKREEREKRGGEAAGKKGRGGRKVYKADAEGKGE